MRLLPPVIVAIVIVVLPFLLQSHDPNDSPRDREIRMWSTADVINGVSVLLAVFFLRSRRKWRLAWRDVPWWLVGVGLYVAILHLSYASPLRNGDPAVFWPAYIGMVIATLVVLGRGYVRRYEGPVTLRGWHFSPQPCEERAEEPNGGIGQVADIPAMILHSYGDLLGSVWLWRGLDAAEIHTASEILHALGGRDFVRAGDHLRSLSRTQADRVMRWLVQLEYVRCASGAAWLSLKGERVLCISKWTVV